MTRHHLFNPDGKAPAVGFSHGAIADEGSTLHIAGQTGHYSDLTIGEDIVDQFARACQSLAKVIVEAGGEPSDLVSLTVSPTASVPASGGTPPKVAPLLGGEGAGSRPSRPRL